ncbi:MAG: ABC transporter ATP-binding protein [Bacilli bacterium]
MEILKCQNLSKSFNRKSVLKDISFKIEPGKIVGLLGPNGSGKTTLIKMINGLLIPTKGEILIKGYHPGVETKRIVSYLPDKNYLDKDMKVSELITFFKTFYTDFDSVKAYQLLEHLNLNKDDRLKTMSKGTKEKVQLVLVMSRKAELYILDEPIGGVDPAARDYILDTILTSFEDKNASIIISTHLIADIEKILDEVIMINKGDIVMQGSCDTLREKSGCSIDQIFREEFKC